MEMFANFKFVQDIAHELVQPRPCTYMALDIWKHISNKELYHYQNPHFDLPETRNIALHLIQRTGPRNTETPMPSTCLVYLHGLSSFSVEGTFLVQNLQKHFSDLNLSLCLYDLRGHGRDKAENVTFGLEQSKQLYHILLFLKQQKHFKQFVLWGRSMGATTILKMLNDFHPQIQQNNLKIKYLVLDSAFCSIQKVAIEIISKKSLMPEIFCKPVFEYVASTVQKLYKIRLEVDITNLHRFQTSALFLYSDIDNLVSAEHSKILFNKYTGPKDKIQMNVGHNDPRPDHVLISIFEKLRQSLKIQPNEQRRKSLSTKKMGLSVTKNKRVKTNQSAVDESESCPTENFYEIKTEESNKQNFKTFLNKSQQYCVPRNSFETQTLKHLKNKSDLKVSPKIYKIAKEHTIKELKLTKKYISLNGNMKPSVQMFKENQVNNKNAKENCQKKQQKLKLSHKELVSEIKSEFYQDTPKHKTSIYEKGTPNKSQAESKNFTERQIENTDYSRFTEFKSALLIKNTHETQTQKTISPNTKQTERNVKFEQNDIIYKKLYNNQPNCAKISNRTSWNANHITQPTAKPQSSSNTTLTQKRMSNPSVPSSSRKEIPSEIKLGPMKQFASIRKSIDLELLKIENMSPIYQSCIISNNVTPQNSGQKVVFNFQSNEPKKVGTVQRLSNQYYM